MSDQIIATIELIDTVTIKVPSAQGLPGPQGPAGPPGIASMTMTAGMTLSGHRIVTTDASGNAIYADSATLAHKNAVVGLTLGAASSAAPVQVQSVGEVSDPSFAFTPGQTLWLGTNGQIVTAAPTTGFSLVIGYAETATKIFIHVGQPIVLL